MDPNFSFQRSEDSESEDNSQAIYFRNQIADYSETLEVALGAKTTIIFGQPVENRSVYIMERRPGCELGVAVINDRIRHSRYAFVEQLTSENVISFLGYRLLSINPIWMVPKCRYITLGLTENTTPIIWHANKKLTRIPDSFITILRREPVPT